MRSIFRRGPSDPYSDREPFPFTSAGPAGATPLRSPLALLLVGLALLGFGIALIGWALATALAEPAEAPPLWQLVGMSALLLLIPLPMVWIGVVRLRWQRQHRRLTGSQPVSYRD